MGEMIDDQFFDGLNSSIEIYLFCTLGLWDKTIASSIYIVVFGHK